jgi:hypothetical protein
MAASLTEIRNAIKAALDIKDFNAYAVEPPAPKPPAGWSFPAPGNAAEFHQTFDDAVTWHMRVTVVVAATDVGRSQSNIDVYLAPTGERSIKALLEADPSLGGVVDSVSVKGIVAYGALDIAGTSAVAATFDVEVFA